MIPLNSTSDAGVLEAGIPAREGSLTQHISSLLGMEHVQYPSRSELITEAVKCGEALVSSCGALAVWTPSESTGRIPQDTYMVRSGNDEGKIDWTSPSCIPMEEGMFDELFRDALDVLESQKVVYAVNRYVGVSPRYALSVRILTPSALTGLFADNMFLSGVKAGVVRPLNVFGDTPFTLLVLPHHKVSAEKYRGKLRTVNGETVPQLVAMDFDRRLGLVYGSLYCGCVKKLMFTVMNEVLPEHGVLPLHCAAVEDEGGNTHLFLGLSGTGKTTLSSDPRRALIGDDEHLWSEDGIANMENGCYAKLIRLRREKEPDIYDAVFNPATLTLPSPFKGRGIFPSGVIVENAMMYPDGHFDLDDARYTENSRASYPLSFLRNAKEVPRGGHPKIILFLTADAHGVLPPVAKLSKEQAMLWFLMGYTSKIPGTETGVTMPRSTFSRFFGGPFMPRKPQDYLSLFEQKLKEHGTDVYLVNTGWSGGPYGIGSRMDIGLTRRLVDAAVSGGLKDVPFEEDSRFHLSVPCVCPGVDSQLLQPKVVWGDPDAFDREASVLAQEFSSTFDRTFGHLGIPEEVKKECPGK